MTASTKRAAQRKPVSEAEKAYLQTLPPKLRRAHRIARTLEGKLTKAIAVKA